MGAGHSHGIGQHHGAGHAGARHRWRLAAAVVLIGGFFVVELVAALLSGSLALLSDAGHMAADVVVLVAALVATVVAAKPDPTGRRTFGRYRSEVFASGLAVLVMLGVGVYIVVEAIGRIGTGSEVATGPMLAVGALGLVVNLIALALLHGGAGESLNVKGAYLEVLADTLGSIGVIAAALLVAATGAQFWDALIAVAIAVFVIVRALMLGSEVLVVLGQQAPPGIDPAEVHDSLRGIDGVEEVHDLHLWRLTSGVDIATAHLVVGDLSARDAVLHAATERLQERFGISCATLQLEPMPRDDCHDARV